MVNTILFRFDLIRFLKYFSVCSRWAHNKIKRWKVQNMHGQAKKFIGISGAKFRERIIYKGKVFDYNPPLRSPRDHQSFERKKKPSKEKNVRKKKMFCVALLEIKQDRKYTQHTKRIVSSLMKSSSQTYALSGYSQTSLLSQIGPKEALPYSRE